MSTAARPLGSSPAPTSRIVALSPRLVGIVGLLASPMLLVQAPLQRLTSTAPDRELVMGLTSLVYIVGFAASAMGLRRLRATGDGVGARIVFGVQMLGLALAALWSALYLVPPGSGRTALLRATDPAWPLSHFFMLIVGILVLRTGRLRGWRRYPALLCGLALPLFLVMRSAGAPPAAMGYAFPLLTTVAFGLLALAVATSDR